MTGRWVGGEFAFVTPEKAQSLQANLARSGDLVFTQRGTLGQAAIVPEDRDAYLVSQSQMKLTPDIDQVDPIFLYYQFVSPKMQEYIRQNVIQTGVPHTNLGILRDTPLVLPPLEEQRGIGALLATLDDKIELNRRINETVEEIARAIFKSWFVDFEPVRAKMEGRQPAGMSAAMAALFPNALVASDLGPIPSGWKLATIGEMVQVVGGSTPSTEEPSYWGGPHFFATPKDLSGLDSPVLLETERTLTVEGVERISSGILPVGTVLLSSRAPIGYVAIAGVPVSVNQGFIAMICDEELPTHYVALWTKSNVEMFKQNAGGTTFAEISKKAFRPLPVLVPPEPILDDFRSTVSPLYEAIGSNVRESTTLADLRDALLPKLISGELRLQAAEDYAAEALS